jgi:hypothetical protein
MAHHPKLRKPKGVIELSRGLQGGALRFIKSRWDGEQPFSEFWADLYNEDKLGAARLMISLMPKEHLIEATVSGQVELNTGAMNPALLREAMQLARSESSQVIEGEVVPTGIESKSS